MRDSKVADQVALTDTHDSRDAGRQVHRWDHDSKAAVAKIAVTPVVPKAAATSAAASTVHHRDAVSIASVLPVRPKAVGSSENATRVVPKVRVSNEIGSPAHAAANLNVSDLMGREVEVSNVNVSPVRPITDASTEVATRGPEGDR